MLDLFENETTPDGGEDGGAPEAPDTPVVDPVAAEPAAAEPVAVPAEVNWDDINVLNQAAERLQALGYTIAPTEPAPPPAAPEYDPFDPESIDAFIEAKLAQRLGPVEQFAVQQQTNQLRDEVSQQIDAAITQHNIENPPDKPVFAGIADGFIATGLDRNTAIAKAAEWLAADRKAAADKGIQDYLNGLTADGSTRFEPPVNGAAVDGNPQPRNEFEVARLFNQRRNATAV